ncbi:MAG: hypothetical protein ABI595_05775 [Actinomycetota bacterium]
MRTRTQLSIMLLAVAIAATACGGSGDDGSGQVNAGASDGPSSAASISPSAAAQAAGTGACALITQEEAASAAGMDVPSGKNSTASVSIAGAGSIESQTCLYGSEVLVGRFDLGSAGATLFAAYRDSLTSESDFEVVTGLGDEAFFAKGQLAVRQGDIGLIMDVGQNTGTTSGEQEEEQGLAVIALGRL